MASDPLACQQNIHMPRSGKSCDPKLKLRPCNATSLQTEPRSDQARHRLTMVKGGHSSCRSPSRRTDTGLAFVTSQARPTLLLRHHPRHGMAVASVSATTAMTLVVLDGAIESAFPVPALSAPPLQERSDAQFL